MLRLEVNIDAEFHEGVEPPLRFVNAERNHVRRDDEVLRISELRTPSERVAVEPPPQVDFAVDSSLDVVDVNHVLHVDSRVHSARAVGVGDMVGLLVPKLLRRFRAGSGLH